MMSKNYRFTISVIVPVYNVENYLRRCLDSILAQSFKDFEIILVDDGSKDGSGIICDEYKKLDKRISVLHKENGGVSTARNAGIEIAKGEWICFVDSDDYVKPDYLLKMIKKTEDLQEDKTYLVMTGLLSSTWTAKLPDDTIDINNVPALIANEKLPLGPICKLFLSDIVKRHRIQFQEGITNGEDFVFVCNYLCHTDGIRCFDSAEYVYEIQNGSASKRYMPFDENLRNYRAMRTAWENMVEMSKTADDKQYLLWHGGVQTRFSYLLTGIFHKPMCSVREQLCLLRRIKGDIEDFSHNADIHVKRSYIARFLLRKKYLFLYVLFNRLMVMIGKEASA